MAEYKGEVCYMDGWHYTVDKNGQPGKKLFSNGDGTYRLAKDGDPSHHEQYHQLYVTAEMT